VYKLMAIVCVLFLFFTAARGNAQRFNLFGGYSYSGYDPNVSPKTSLYGWNGSLEIKVLPFLGFVADSSGHYGNETFTSLLLCRAFVPPPAVPNCTANANVSLCAFTAGPQVSLPLGRFKPYAHALFGAALFRQDTGTVDIGTSTSISFADELGGGVDVSIVPGVAWRVQADDLQIWPHRSFCVNGICRAPVQNSIRLSTGVVFRF
jgi:hypothetical protein